MDASLAAKWLEVCSNLERTTKTLAALNKYGEVVAVDYNLDEWHKSDKGPAWWRQIDIEIAGRKPDSDVILGFIDVGFKDEPTAMGFRRRVYILEGLVFDPVERRQYGPGAVIEVEAGTPFITNSAGKACVLIIQIFTHE